MLRLNPEKAGIIKFLKSPLFALASAGLAWWTWDKQWAGAIPALAFLAAFYAALWRAYHLARQGAVYLPEGTLKLAGKLVFLLLPVIAGLIVFPYVYLPGGALIFAGFVLILWKLPVYWTLHAGKNSLGAPSEESYYRKRVFFILCGLLFFTLSPAIYYQYQYNQAVSRLSHDSHSIRLNAIYSLGDFAMDHGAYYERVVQVLAARVRELVPGSNRKNDESRQMALHILQLLGGMQKNKDRITTPLNLQATDISKFSLRELDFRKAVLLGADLSGSCFFHSDLSGINARHAVMHKAEMRYMDANQADFFAVRATEADCRYSRFKKAKFRYGSWKGSNFSASHMRHAVIRGRALKGVRLYRARMEHVNARGAHFQNSNFRRARLDEGAFYKARFNGADLREASLKKANLKKALFVNADLRGADMTGAVFEGTNFKGADLRGMKGLGKEALKKIIVNDKTRMDE